MRIPIWQLDAFSPEPFRGNPAAVCLLADWPAEDWLQRVAAENNLSETAFLVPAGPGRYELRWFTPKVEVDLCGHATLAAAWVLLHETERARPAVTFQTRSGELAVERCGEGLRMDFPAVPAEAPGLPPPVLSALKTPVAGAWRVRELHAATYGLALLESEAAVRAAAPDLAALGRAGANLIVTAPSASPQSDFVSRFFAPASGVAEDPVTGSAHCTLAPFWAQRLGRSRLRARQLSARGGELTCELMGQRVAIEGTCAPYLCGTIAAPPGTTQVP